MCIYMYIYICAHSFDWNCIRNCAGGAFGGNRGARPVPPEKGVFPLDHMHLCDLVVFISDIIAAFFYVHKLLY